MITIYSSAHKFQPVIVVADNQALLQAANWIDLVAPSKEEEVLVEKLLDLKIPTREEMQEIEISSRLYKEDDAIFMTIWMVAKSDFPDPTLDSVMLILTKDKLITIRYTQSQTFSLFASRLPKLPTESQHARFLAIELLEAGTYRLADIFESVGRGLDKYSQIIFRSQSMNGAAEGLDYKQLLQDIGSNGDLNTKALESAVSFNRLIAFFERAISAQLHAEMESRLAALKKDINALIEYTNILSNKVNFLLDATLGMVYIDQNNVIKISSIAAVIFTTPTLIASIYGMNFKIMPELEWYFGYPIAVGLMLLSSWLPYKIFKLKKWL